MLLSPIPYQYDNLILETHCQTQLSNLGKLIIKNSFGNKYYKDKML
jgi:hypothetical protein